MRDATRHFFLLATTNQLEIQEGTEEHLAIREDEFS
jgi:hypothetical protein